MNSLMKKALLMLPLLLLAGCHDSVTIAGQAHSRGHWGDRSDWNHPDYVQDYFADSDGHLVGWVVGSNAMSIRAHCEDAEDTDEGNLLGAFETQEDAQMAVEARCPLVRQPTD